MPKPATLPPSSPRVTLASIKPEDLLYGDSAGGFNIGQHLADIINFRPDWLAHIAPHHAASIPTVVADNSPTWLSTDDIGELQAAFEVPAGSLNGFFRGWGAGVAALSWARIAGGAVGSGSAVRFDNTLGGLFGRLCACQWHPTHAACQQRCQRRHDPSGKYLH